MSDSINRRQFIQNSLLAMGVTGGAIGHAAGCILTRSQGEGPYYPQHDLNRDQDLTRLDPKGAIAEGTVIELSGLIQDTACKAVAGALVEIWQANKFGKYDHTEDENPLPKDPNFQHWGRMTTGKDGAYLFRTITPGYYPLDPKLVGKKPSAARQFRPPHIHMKVHARGFAPLTTQIYFDANTYDDAATRDIVDDLNGWESVPSDLKVLYSADPKDASKPRTGKISITLLRR